ncbi:MAG: cytidine deaminase [Candidatus Marinimicrobia bacterium]|jgi:cytidine deaminase|nr:cytidine deaminase [Candidatus Neomarinimicrobiota bacterium]MBT3496375.1 cytidine deaminase [Candidatus Neomarinimicrobiota bacterium]MBT3692618.1 cytidine deaminase [Candidatus Neomarinimicrobiota bacterium]MBT3732260.1 cytidine deaminase [Candidatus Neomarinimicrobiota bacterium]MBT4143698.1 cytidine deaminase [Candidatus Neomarinimicrobiota bacterium]
MNTLLIQKAISMRNKAHAPYSNYHVGAAVESHSGKIIGGCNVESSSYSLTCCAERVALFSAISEDLFPIKALAVSTENGGTPCGACRQVIWDLCGDIPIYICDNQKMLRETSSKSLLPDAFDQSLLKG